MRLTIDPPTDMPTTQQQWERNLRALKEHMEICRASYHANEHKASPANHRSAVQHVNSLAVAIRFITNK